MPARVHLGPEEPTAEAEVRITHIAEQKLGGRGASAALNLLEELQAGLELMRRRDEITRLMGNA